MKIFSIFRIFFLVYFLGLKHSNAQCQMNETNINFKGVDLCQQAICSHFDLAKPNFSPICSISCHGFEEEERSCFDSNGVEYKYKMSRKKDVFGGKRLRLDPVGSIQNSEEIFLPFNRKLFNELIVGYCGINADDVSKIVINENNLTKFGVLPSRYFPIIQSSEVNKIKAFSLLKLGKKNPNFINRGEDDIYFFPQISKKEYSSLLDSKLDYLGFKDRFNNIFKRRCRRYTFHKKGVSDKILAFNIPYKYLSEDDLQLSESDFSAEAKYFDRFHGSDENKYIFKEKSPCSFENDLEKNVIIQDYLTRHYASFSKHNIEEEAKLEKLSNLNALPLGYSLGDYAHKSQYLCNPNSDSLSNRPVEVKSAYSSIGSFPKHVLGNFEVRFLGLYLNTPDKSKFHCLAFNIVNKQVRKIQYEWQVIDNCVCSWNVWRGNVPKECSKKQVVTVRQGGQSPVVIKNPTRPIVKPSFSPTSFITPSRSSSNQDKSSFQLGNR